MLISDNEKKVVDILRGRIDENTTMSMLAKSYELNNYNIITPNSRGSPCLFALSLRCSFVKV